MEMQVLNLPIAEILNMLIMLLGVAIVCIAAFSYQKRSSIRMQAAPWTKLLQHICYSEKSIRNYKQRIAHKLGVSSADLHEHLQNDILTYLYNDNINPKK